jgi:hypothetical protein
MQTMPPPRKPKKAGGRPRSAEPKLPLASLKGSEKYRKWLEGLARHAHLPVAILIEHALREYASTHGYDQEQPQR